MSTMEASANRFLTDFTPAARDHLIGQLINEDYPHGAYLFHEGDPADGVCMVLDGRVEIVKRAGNGEQILGVFEPGDFLGEVAVLDGQGRSTSARASGVVSIARIPREQLLEVLSTEPVSLTIGLFQHVLAHLRKTNDLFVSEVVRKEKLSLVGEMASSLMHDLRNPVSGIRLAADLVNMNHSDEETVLCCDRIRLQCDRLVVMATELLEFSRGESKLNLGRTITTAFFDQFKMLNEDYFLGHANVKFNFEIEPAEIVIDSMRLLRVVQNLMTNAVEAIGSKSGGLIEFRAGVENDIFYLTVSDNGPGIPEAVRGRLFEPFATYGKVGGTGLGMAIVRNVITAHGGSIIFETVAGQGTAFSIQFPKCGPS
jgi:signal transduction histidine kinase